MSRPCENRVRRVIHVLPATDAKLQKLAVKHGAFGRAIDAVLGVSSAGRAAGAGVGLETSASEATDNDTAQQRAANDVTSTEDATGALAAALLFGDVGSVASGLRADPCVEFEHGGIRHRGQSSDSVISVEDGIATYLAHQHARGRDLSVTADELLKAHETLVSVGDSLKTGMRVSEDMVLKQSAYRALCDWSEANRREGKFTPFPAELRDYLYPELQKEAVPRSTGGGSELSGERPSDTTDDRAQPDVENLVRHVAENPSGGECVHTTPNDTALAPDGPKETL